MHILFSNSVTNVYNIYEPLVKIKEKEMLNFISTPIVYNSMSMPMLGKRVPERRSTGFNS